MPRPRVARSLVGDMSMSATVGCFRVVPVKQARLLEWRGGSVTKSPAAKACVAVFRGAHLKCQAGGRHRNGRTTTTGRYTDFPGMSTRYEGHFSMQFACACLVLVLRWLRQRHLRCSLHNFSYHADCKTATRQMRWPDTFMTWPDTVKACAALLCLFHYDCAFLSLFVCK